MCINDNNDKSLFLIYLKFHFTRGQNKTETITCSLMQWYSEITIFEEKHYRVYSKDKRYDTVLGVSDEKYELFRNFIECKQLIDCIADENHC